jgi:hypothetical protein
MKKKTIIIPESNCEKCPFHRHDVHDYWRCCWYGKLRKSHPVIGFLKPKWCKIKKVTSEEEDS